MVKFIGHGYNGITLIGLGLEAENIKRLQAGQPIRVRLRDLGFVGAVSSIELFIFADDDAAAMRKKLAQFIGPETVVIGE